MDYTPPIPPKMVPLMRLVIHSLIERPPGTPTICSLALADYSSTKRQHWDKSFLRITLQSFILGVILRWEVRSYLKWQNLMLSSPTKFPTVPSLHYFLALFPLHWIMHSQIR